MLEDKEDVYEELASSHDEVVHLLNQIPSVSEESKKLRYFSTIPALATRRFGSSGLNVFHYAAIRESGDILNAFALEAKLCPESNQSTIEIASDDHGDHPFVYALVDYENGPDFALARLYLESSAKSDPRFRPQWSLRRPIVDILRLKTRMKLAQPAQPTFSVWSDGLDIFENAYQLLAPQFADFIPEAASSEIAKDANIAWEKLSTLHLLPLPYLCLVLLGFKLKTSLRHKTVKVAFDTQEDAVERCLEFLETYLRFSSDASLKSLIDESKETIFEFIFRLYFMQVGDPLQLMRFFRFFLSWIGLPAKTASGIFRSVASNPLLNPIERLNYVVLVAAAGDSIPLHRAVDDDLEERPFSVIDAIATIEFSAARLSSALVPDALELHRNVVDDQVRVETERDEGLVVNAVVDTENGAVRDSNQEIPPPAPDSKIDHREADDFPGDDDDEEECEESFLPALSIIAIGNCLCRGPPSLKYLVRRFIRTRVELMTLFESDDGLAGSRLPKFIVDYLRMEEYRNVKINFDEQTVPNSGVPNVEDGPEMLISFEKTLYLQIPVIYHC